MLVKSAFLVNISCIFNYKLFSLSHFATYILHQT